MISYHFLRFSIPSLFFFNVNGFFFVKTVWETLSAKQARFLIGNMHLNAGYKLFPLRAIIW